MNVMEAMKIKKEGGRIERKLDNGLTEVKIFYMNGQICEHYFEDENGNRHGEFKWWREDGTLDEHELYEDGELIKDYLNKFIHLYTNPFT